MISTFEHEQRAFDFRELMSDAPMTNFRRRTLVSRTGGYGHMSSFIHDAYEHGKRLILIPNDLPSDRKVTGEIQVDLNSYLPYEQIAVYGVSIWHQFPREENQRHLLVVAEDEPAAEVQLVTITQ